MTAQPHRPRDAAGKPYEIVDFATVAAVPCPCGSARRAFAAAADFPATVHVTDIRQNARVHYHRRITEVYYILECAPNARMRLDDNVVPLRPGMSILIRPGTRHCALGVMRVLIVASPKFDESDEWFD